MDKYCVARVLFIVCLGCFLPLNSDSQELMSNEIMLFALPEHVNHDEEKAALGRKLFFDTRLSTDDTISCHSCHQFELGGSDAQITSIGLQGVRVKKNAPSVFNTAYNFRHSWTGEFSTMVDLIEKVVKDKKEMGSNWTQIMGKLEQEQHYRNDFIRIYPQGLSADSIKDALAEFVSSLITPNAPFDKYLNGDERALTLKEKEGVKLFMEYGCIACHQGVNVGGNMYQRLGVVESYFSESITANKIVKGRYEHTGRERDKFVFKVPSLRNVALTAPYFHDGHINTLEEAVTIMGRYQLGIQFNQHDVDLIVDFLKTLTGNQPRAEL